jgi:hypothetical protein
MMKSPLGEGEVLKLIFCEECRDVVALRMEERTCICGKSKGVCTGLDGLHATISGPAIPLGFANHSFGDALRNQPETGMGKEFTAFVIQKTCDTVEVI